MRYTFCKLIVLSILFFICNTVFAQNRSIKNTASAIFSYKESVNEHTENLVKYINILISTPIDDNANDRKNEVYFKAKRLFLSKKDNANKEIIIRNFLNELQLDQRSMFTSTDLLDALKGYANAKNMDFEIDEKDVADMYYNQNMNNYAIKVNLLIKAVISNDEEDGTTLFTKDLDVLFITASDNRFYIKSIDIASDKMPEGYALVKPVADEEKIPGANITFRVNPLSSQIQIDGNNIDYLYGEKFPIDMGEHIISISTDDDYEYLPPFKVWVKSDTDKLIVDKSIEFKKGTLSIVPGSECGFNADASILKSVYYSKMKGVGKRKHQVQKSKWVEIAQRKLPFDLELEAGQYKFKIIKPQYISRPKHKTFSISPNLKNEYTINFIDIESKIKPGPVRCTTCNLFNTKGNKCNCCFGSGKCEMCKGTGKRECRCCNGLGQFTLNSKDYKNCSMCAGQGSISCDHCNGSGRCCACGGDGIW